MVEILLLQFMSLLINENYFKDEMKLDFFRENYEVAVTNKKLCETMIEELKTNTSSHERLAYLGGLQAVWANHLFNPISKLKTFERGKNNIEIAIKNAPDNYDVRYVRLSVQKNIPDFLNYKQNIEEDKRFLMENLDKVQSKVLFTKIKALIKQ